MAPSLSGEPHIESLDVDLPSSSPAPMGARIGIAGAGGVASFAHIPAYRKLGISPVALFDTEQAGLDRAMRALGAAPSPTTFSSTKKFLAELPSLGLDVLDVAVPSPAHHDFLTELFDTCGSDCPALLVQKPLAKDSTDAASLVRRAADLGVPMAINLNARWVPTFRKAHEMLRQGIVGETPLVSVVNRGLNRKDGEQWRSRISRLIAYEMAVHHVDLLCWLFGPVSSVYSVVSTVPGLGVGGDNSAMIILRFASGAVANVVEDWACRDKEAWRYHPEAEEIVISGSQGTVVATPKDLRIVTDKVEAHCTTNTSWFPDAFAGPMAELLSALRQGRESELSAAKHVEVLRVLDAVYESSRTGESVRLAPLEVLVEAQ